MRSLGGMSARRLRPIRAVWSLLAAAVFLAGGCADADRATTGGSAVADSARTAAMTTDFEAPVDPRDWVGIELAPYPPEEVERLAGAVWDADGDDRTPADWGVSHVRIGGRPMLWLTQVTRRVEEPITRDGARIGSRMTPHQVVRDVLVLPVYTQDERVELYRCRTVGGAHAAVIGLPSADPSRIGYIRLAWVLDPAERRLVEAEPGGIDC